MSALDNPATQRLAWTTSSHTQSCVVVFDTLRQGERVELGLLVDAVSLFFIGMAEGRADFGAQVDVLGPGAFRQRPG